MPYYRSTIIGDGTRQNPYRARMAEHVSRHSAIMPRIINIGTPSQRPEFSDCVVWTSRPYSESIEGISQITRSECQSILSSRGIIADLNHLERT